MSGLMLGTVLLFTFQISAAASDAKDIGTVLNASKCATRSLEDAIAACSVAIESGKYSGPDLSLLYSNRGKEYHRLAVDDKALADFNKAIQLDPHNAFAFHNRCGLYDDQEKFDQAVSDCNEAIRLKPEASQNANEANNKDFALLAPRSGYNPYFNRGVAWRGKNELRRAIADFTETIKRDKWHDGAYNNRGMSFQALGEYDSAIADYTEAIRLQPNDFRGYFNRGRTLAVKGDLERAITDYNEAIKRFPDFNQMYRARGVTYYNLGKYSAAADDLRRSLELVAANPWVMIWRYLARARLSENGAPELSKNASKLNDRSGWPQPAIEFFLGRRSLESMRAAAEKPLDKCQTEFYAGEWYSLHDKLADAKRAWQSAVDICERFDNFEYEGAVAQLKRVNPTASVVDREPKTQTDAPTSSTERRAATDPVANIPDTYSIAGANPNGSTYGGEVTVTTDGELYYFRWRISGGQTFRGKGRLRGRTLTIDWGQNYPVMYRVQDDGKLVGTWANGRGREDLTPQRTATRPAATQSAEAGVDCSQAETHWKSAEAMGTRDVYEDHLKRFSNCAFATLAKARISSIDQKGRGSNSPSPIPEQSASTPTPTQSDSPKKAGWAAIAAVTWLNSNRAAEVVTGFARDEAGESAAVATALEKCRSNQPGNDCKIVATWNKGCGYITIGTSKDGVHWSVRKSRDEARKACEAGGYDCDKPASTIGGCLDEVATATKDVASRDGEAANNYYWGALACGLWKDGSGRAHVAVGSALKKSSSGAAVNAALAACREGGGQNCQLEGGGAVNHGCGFIAAGSSGDKVWCVTRTSVAEVLARCRELGAHCNTPIGGCLTD